MAMKQKRFKVAESRQERADRIARAIIDAEQQSLQRKTARLRALRLGKEKSTA